MFSTFSPPYEPNNWYWKAEDGRVFSSARNQIVTEADADYTKWIALKTPTSWPRDAEGAQTDAALQEVVGPYGVTMKTTASDAGPKLRRP